MQQTYKKTHRGAHIVYRPTPGHFLAHQKACCERRFRHMSHHFLLFLSQNGLMKGGHFVICIGTCSPSKLGHGWKQNLLYFCVCVRISRLQALCFLVIFPLKECIVSVWCAENWYKNYFKKTKYDTFLTVRSRLYESSHPFIPRMELITWPFTKYRLVHHRLFILCHHHHHHHLLCNRLCDRPGLLVYPPEQGHGSVRYRRRRRVRFLINGRKKCIVIERGAAIVLPGPSSCKSQSQQLKEKIIIMKEKLKTLKPESPKSRNTHLMVHNNVDFKSS